MTATDDEIVQPSATSPMGKAKKSKKTKSGFTRHFAADEGIFIGPNASIRKVVISSSELREIPAALNSAAARVCYTYREHESDLDISKPNAEILTLLSDSVNLKPDERFLVFDRDMGLFGKFSEPPAETDENSQPAELDENSPLPAIDLKWEPPRVYNDKYIYSELLTFAARTMVTAEESLFIWRTKNGKYAELRLVCNTLYSRRRLRPDHATEHVKDWPSYSLELDGSRYAQFSRDDVVGEDYTDCAFLFSSLTETREPTLACLFSIVRFEYSLDGQSHKDEVTIGMGDINPYLQTALTESSVDVEQILFLPQRASAFNSFAYARPCVWSPRDSAECLAGKVFESRYSGKSPESCSIGAFGVLESKDARQWALVDTKLVIEDLRVTSIHKLPDLLSTAYSPECRAEKLARSVGDDTSDDDSSLSSSNDDEYETSSQRKVQFLEYTKLLGNSLFSQKCYLDALRIYIYGLTNIAGQDSNKLYGPRRGDEITIIKKKFEKNTMITLYHLEEYRHSLYMALDHLLPYDYADYQILLWAGRNEVKLHRFAQAEMRIKRALAECQSEADRAVIAQELRDVILERRQFGTKFKFDGTSSIYSDRLVEEELGKHCDAFLARAGIEIQPLSEDH